MRYVRAAAAALLLAAPLAAQTPATPAKAEPAPWKFGWVLDMTFEVGGDEVAEVIFTNGDKQSLTTGDGGTFSAGMEFHPSAMPKLGLRTLVGLKFSTSAAENVDIMFTRFPIEVVASYAVTPDWRIGAGVTHHANINLDFDGLAQNAKFDPATGATLEVGWKWAALTYTSMEYRSRYGDTFDASAIGISVSYVFGKR